MFLRCPPLSSPPTFPVLSLLLVAFVRTESFVDKSEKRM